MVASSSPVGGLRTLQYHDYPDDDQDEDDDDDDGDGDDEEYVDEDDDDDEDVMTRSLPWSSLNCFELRQHYDRMVMSDYSLL